MKTVRFTKSGLEELNREYQTLQEKRKIAVSELKTARELGDLSENAAYKVARTKLSGIDRRIVQISILLRKATVSEVRQDGMVGIGNTVKLQMDNKISIFEIVGTYESDTQRGKISHVSPLGKALMNKRKGDVVQITVPAGVKTYFIIEVS